MKKVLIIKLGYSETLDPEIGKYSSLGDVLRTTVILPCFYGDEVTWLTDEKAYPLLKDNRFIDRILFYDMTTCWQLQEEIFDVLINLEKVPGICALSNRITAWDRYGFRYDPMSGEVKAYFNANGAFDICADKSLKIGNGKTWQEMLFEMIGQKWSGEEYVFDHKLQKAIDGLDIGLNFAVGNKWPSKAWAKENWKELNSILSREYLVSYQRGFDNLEEYFRWINSCRLIITNDSLGLHLAIATKKYVIALFGPTIETEVDLYDRGIKLIAKTDCKHQPCLLPKCKNDKHCMNSITPEIVAKTVREILDVKLNEAA